MRTQHLLAAAGVVDRSRPTDCPMVVVETRCSTYFLAFVPGRLWDLIDERFTTHEGTPRGSALERQVDVILAGRVSVPEDVAKRVSFLAGPDSDHMTGVLMDGGINFA